ncbi:MAG: choice-of-anchor Q domain-containing protein [Actinomycetota bacterium]
MPALRHRSLAFLAGLVIATLVAAAPGAGAVAPLDCSSANLQTAIDAATSGDTISFTGTCVGNFTIDSKSLTLQGSGDAILDANGTGRPLTVHGPATQVVTLDDLLVSGGNVTGLDANGGGILADGGSLALNRSVVRGNSVTGTGIGAGGGISFSPIVGGVQSLTLTDSSVSENTGAGLGPGIGGGIEYVSAGDPLTLVRSTVSGNTISGIGSSTLGGGLSVEAGTLSVTNSTISGNTATAAGISLAAGGGIDLVSPEGGTILGSTITQNQSVGTLGSGGGVTQEAGAFPLTLTSTILAGNAASTGPDCSNLIFPILSGDDNLIGNTTGCTFASQPGDLLNVPQPVLPLLNNGGGTLTHFLPLGSPARNAYAAPCATVTDQRGIARAQSGNCDIGAMEVEVGFPPLLCTISGTAAGETITGTARNDTICGENGNDTLSGGGGGDLLVGGLQHDTLDGNQGNDVLRGKEGRDTLVDSTGADWFFGGYGADSIDSLDTVADDTVDGGRGVDACTHDLGDSVTSC